MLARLAGALARRLTARHWRPEHRRRDPETFWMAHPAVRRHLNRRITGDAGVWPIDWLAERHLSGPLGTVLVPGCGSGELERDLLSKDLCREAHAFDVSAAQVEEAERLAAEAGLGGRVRYRVAEMEGFDAAAFGLEKAAYDACFFHHSLHHSRDLRRVLLRVAEALAPGGLLYLDEYVGPSRRQWDREHFAAARLVYSLLPRERRLHDELRIPGLLAKLEDPSESIASDRIPAAVEERFEVLERRDYGGFLLQSIWTQLRHERGEDDPLVGELIRLEEALGRLHPTWLTVIVARLR